MRATIISPIVFPPLCIGCHSPVAHAASDTLSSATEERAACLPRRLRRRQGVRSRFDLGNN